MVFMGPAKVFNMGPLNVCVGLSWVIESPIYAAPNMEYLKFLGHVWNLYFDPLFI